MSFTHLPKDVVAILPIVVIPMDMTVLLYLAVIKVRGAGPHIKEKAKSLKAVFHMCK